MKQLILGAICGDIIGSVYERFNVLKMDFPLFSRAFTRFTDDTVLTVATMDCQLGKSKNYTLYYQTYGIYRKRMGVNGCLFKVFGGWEKVWMVGIMVDGWFSGCNLGFI